MDISCPFCKVKMRETADNIYTCPDCDSVFRPTSKHHGIKETWREQQHSGNGKGHSEKKKGRKKPPGRFYNPFQEC